MDLDIAHYSIGDLQTLFSLADTASDFEIKDAANKMIAKMKAEGKPTVATFISEARDKLVAYNATTLDQAENQLNEDEENNEQLNPSTTLGNWWKNQYPAQSDAIQNQRITDRNQKVQFFSPTHQQMNQEALGVSQSFNIPIAQGSINPTLRNLNSRIVCVDSQYRQNILPYVDNPNAPTYNTDYTLDLSDPLTGVTSLKLYSIQIPTTWYTFDHALGNTCFDYIGSGGTTHIVDISDGNYTLPQLISVLNTTSVTIDLSFAILPYTNQVSITNTSGIADGTIVFYSDSGPLCRQACGPGTKINQNLGWNLGFRVSSVVIPQGQTVVSNVPADTYGPKYFILVVDDFNNNHLNNGLVNVIDTTTKLSMPTYFNEQDVSCNTTTNQTFMIKSAPRTLTQAQLYTVNEILANRKYTVNRINSPTTTDVLAIIPIQLVNTFRPGPYVQFGQALQANIRTYFGPVNIDRLRVRLLDDKGNVVNLHDNDWSFTMVVEELYQY